MNPKSNTARKEAARVRREQLKEIMLRLGQKATEPEIRREVARAGRPERVCHTVVTSLRNELWPDRIKRGAGYARGQRRRPVTLPSQTILNCPSCGGNGRVRQSHRISESAVRRQRRCFKCRESWWSDEEATWSTDVRRQRAMLATEKECAGCKQLLPISRFRKTDAHLTQSRCVACKSRYEFERHTRKNLIRYGATESLEELLDKQGHCCAVCKKHDSESHWNGKRQHATTRLVVDHNHKTGKFRALLCPLCNSGIGYFKDDPQLMLAAVEYLKKHQEQTQWQQVEADCPAP